MVSCAKGKCGFLYIFNLFDAVSFLLYNKHYNKHHKGLHLLALCQFSSCSWDIWCERMSEVAQSFPFNKVTHQGGHKPGGLFSWGDSVHLSLSQIFPLIQKCLFSMLLSILEVSLAFDYSVPSCSIMTEGSIEGCFLY